MKRRFEFVGGNSAKFWEVDVSGSSVAVCYGRLSTAGQTQNKSFSTVSEAQKHADTLVQKKIGKGYVEQAA
jgi:predicted DNA-binding WGR domain protein